MTMLRVATGTIWLLVVLIGRAMLHPAVAVPVQPSSAPTHARTTSVIVEEEFAPPGAMRTIDSDEPRFDLFGNEIDVAIADYRLDRRGTIYERHSPDTAVSKLGSPKT